MPDIKTDDGCVIHAENPSGSLPRTGSDAVDSLGTTLHMWDEQVAPFTRHFRLLRYDRRGHGKSSVPKGPYSMERLGRDVLAVLDGLGIPKINWCGLSMGGWSDSRRQCRRPRQQAHPVQHVLLFSG